MRFNGLVVETTNRCNAKCGMCYQSAGPKGSEDLGRADLEPTVLTRVIREARSIATLTPRFHLAGGEAFLNIDDCLLLFSTAREAGYRDITATTNGYWARSPGRARQVVRDLRECGVTSLEVSWDVWHEPFIRGTHVAACLEAAREADIETNLRVLTTKSHTLQEALSLLPTGAVSLAHRVTSAPVFATGRASRQVSHDDIHGSEGDVAGSCHAALNLTVNSFGNVFPCCAGFDQTKEYVLGNVRTESIVDIARRIDADPIVRTVVFRGVSALLPILDAAGVAPDGRAKNMCELCWSIFSSPERVHALRQHSRRAVARALAKTLDALSADVDVRDASVGAGT